MDNSIQPAGVKFDIIYNKDKYTRHFISLPIKLVKDGGRMIVDPSFQRQLNKAHSSNIANEFNPLAVKVFRVNIRTDGIISLIDGQQERAALEQIGYSHWMCDASHGLSLKEEAMIFKLGNTQKPINASDMFRSDIVSENKRAQATIEIVRAAGFDIKMRGHDLNSPNVLRSIKTVQFLYNHYDGNVLRYVLNTIKKLWGNRGVVNPSATNNELLFGLGSVYGEDNVPYETLVKQMAGITLEMVRDYVRKKCPNRGRSQEGWYRYYFTRVKCGFDCPIPKES